MTFENTRFVLAALMQTHPLSEIPDEWSREELRLIEALSRILPVVLPEELRMALSTEQIGRLIATLLVELPVRQVLILRDALANGTLQSVVHNMMQEYAQLLAQVMSGKLQMSPEATAYIKKEGLFKALDYMQMEHSSNNSESPECIASDLVKKRGLLKALERQMDHRRTSESPEFIETKREEPFTTLDYMQMEPAINKGLKSRQIFNMWNQTALTGTVRVQEVCRSDTMLNIVAVMLTIGLEPKNNVSTNMPASISQVKEAWYRGNLKTDPIATTVMRGFNLVFGSVIEVPVLIVKSILVDTGILVGRLLGDCIRSKRTQAVTLADTVFKVKSTADIDYGYKQIGKEMIQGSSDTKVEHDKKQPDQVQPTLDTIHSARYMMF